MNQIFPPDKLGELILLIVMIIAALVQVFSEKKKKQIEEEPCDNLLETVTTREDLLNIISRLEGTANSLEKYKIAAEDNFKIIYVLSLAINSMSRSKRMLYSYAEQAFAYMRHEEFPSKEMITGIIEIACDSIRKPKGEELNCVDTGSGK